MNTTQTVKMESAQALQLVLSTCEAAEKAIQQELERALAAAQSEHDRSWGEAARGFEQRKVALEAQRTALRQHAGGPLFQAVSAADAKVGEMMRRRDQARGVRAQLDRLYEVINRVQITDLSGGERRGECSTAKQELSSAIQGLATVALRDHASDQDVESVQRIFEEARRVYEEGTRAVHSETVHLFEALEGERLAAETAARADYERVCAAATAVRDERLARISQRRQEALDSF